MGPEGSCTFKEPEKAIKAGRERKEARRAKIHQGLIEQLRDFSLNYESIGKPLDGVKMKIIRFSFYL